jgi:hypothetical protein
LGGIAEDPSSAHTDFFAFAAGGFTGASEAVIYLTIAIIVDAVADLG